MRDILKILPDQIFGKWKVIKQVKSKDGKNAWLQCICDCGNTKEIVAYSLKNGSSKSCGCGTHFSEFVKKIDIKDRRLEIRKLIKNGYSKSDILANVYSSKITIKQEFDKLI